MSAWSVLFRSILIGLAIAAPVGPVGMICIRRSLSQGRLIGFLSGMGAAVADSMYAVVAVLGLTAISDFLIRQRPHIELFGGIFLVGLGVKMFFGHPQPMTDKDDDPQDRTASLMSAFVSVVGLTLTNPITILSFIGIFANFGITAAMGTWMSFLTVFGVFFGSTLWWIVLSTGASWIGPRLNQQGMKLVNYFSGAIVVGFGGFQLLTYFRR